MLLRFPVPAAAVLLACSAWASPESFVEASSIRKEQGPSLCRLLALERDMAGVIKASGQSAKDFMARSADDPDPQVQRFMAITQEIQSIARAEAARTQRLGTLVRALTHEERQEFQREHRAQLERCPP